MSTTDNHVTILFKDSSTPIKFSNIINEWQEGAFYCVLVNDTQQNQCIYKYPIDSIFRVKIGKS